MQDATRPEGAVVVNPPLLFVANSGGGVAGTISGDSVSVERQIDGILSLLSRPHFTRLLSDDGVSFVRGTIRVNLRQFFQMTTVILMVVVVQLAITGLHELSEGQILPSSSREMAVIGPVVRNDVFGFTLTDDQVKQIETLETSESLFFDHRDPEKVAWLNGRAV